MPAAGFSLVMRDKFGIRDRPGRRPGVGSLGLSAALTVADDVVTSTVPVVIVVGSWAVLLTTRLDLSWMVEVGGVAGFLRAVRPGA